MNYKALTSVGIPSNLLVVLFRTTVLMLLFFLLTSLEGFSQGKAITVNGRDAILKPNGKWEYAKKEKQEPQVSKKDCVYSKNQFDDTKGSTVKVLERENIVSHTPEELKKISTAEHYFAIDAYLSKHNNLIALFMKISINTNNPHKDYGAIDKDSKLILKLKNGEMVTLFSGQSESGKVDYAHDKTTYMAFFELNGASIELLQKAELEMMRLNWNEGYEDFPINNPDFLIRQIRCVK